MFVDLLDADNYLLVNVSLIQVLGLSGAAYCSELFTIMKKAIKKEKLVNSVYVKVDREYVESRTGVSIAEQMALEDKWQKMDLIERKDGDTDNVFNVNTGGFLALISGQGEFTKTEIDKLKSKLKPKTSAQERENKKNGIAKSVKNNLVCSVPEIKEKMFEWIDTMRAADKPISNNTAKVFLDEVSEYAAGDISVAIKVIDKAITNAYADAGYAISAYKTSLKNKKLNPKSEFRRATSLGGNKF